MHIKKHIMLIGLDQKIPIASSSYACGCRDAVFSFSSCKTYDRTEPQGQSESKTYRTYASCKYGDHISLCRQAVRIETSCLVYLRPELLLLPFPISLCSSLRIASCRANEGVLPSSSFRRVSQINLLNLIRLNDHNSEILPRRLMMQVINLLTKLQ